MMIKYHWLRASAIVHVVSTRVHPPSIEHAPYSACGSAIVHVVSAQVRLPSSMVFAVIRGGGVHDASPDLCQGIEGKIWI